MATDNSAWQLIRDVFPHTRCLAIGGNPGLGKTYIAIEQAKKIEQKSYSVTLTEETPSSELRGHYIVKDGNFVWHDGPATKAWREGGCLILNEIQRASGDALSFLIAITDSKESAQIALPTNETLFPNPKFRCVATYNESLDTIPEALRDRFVINITVTTPNPDAIEALPENLRAAAQSSAAAEPARRVSLRAWFEFASLSTKIDPEVAAKAIFGTRAGDILNGLKLDIRPAASASFTPPITITAESSDKSSTAQIERLITKLKEEAKESTPTGPYKIELDVEVPKPKAMIAVGKIPSSGD